MSSTKSYRSRLLCSVNVDAVGTMNATWQLYEYLCPSSALTCIDVEKAWNSLRCCDKRGGDAEACAGLRRMRPNRAATPRSEARRDARKSHTWRSAGT